MHAATSPERNPVLGAALAAPAALVWWGGLAVSGAHSVGLAVMWALIAGPLAIGASLAATAVAAQAVRAWAAGRAERAADDRLLGAATR